MHGPTVSSQTLNPTEAARATGYVWCIALVAALGGLLFGYDWVVIGGARQFFEIYFHLDSPAAVGWANSCALVGCFAGSLIAGVLGNRYGRKPVLLISAVLFAVSSILTGWAFSFSAFILWRIIGGVAIGLSSNISPTYIAEVSPASHRGRLVSLNQFAVVIGILLAQIANWRIAMPVPEHVSAEIHWHPGMFSSAGAGCSQQLPSLQSFSLLPHSQFQRARGGCSSMGDQDRHLRSCKRSVGMLNMQRSSHGRFRLPCKTMGHEPVAGLICCNRAFAPYFL